MSNDIQTLSRTSSRSAGIDLHSASDHIIGGRSNCLVNTGIKLQIPEGHYGRIAARSGLAANYSIDVGAGVIDEDYRGEIKVLLFNHSDNDFVISKGDRIAQLICEKISYPKIIEEASLDNSERAEKGFGSSGVK